ncbi:MAG: 4'-phosphopantetheinyl transferase superfamily protein [Hyphomicrobiaceae bacterium]
MAATIAIRTISLNAIGGECWTALLDLLDSDEQRRALSFVFERHRQQFVVAHALKRLMISAVTGSPPRSLRFKAVCGSKPWLYPTGWPHFNLSHCEGMVACAISLDIDVGIDVEPLNRADALALADWCCSPTEQQWLTELPAANRPHGFMKMWTLKEAVLKAAGCGVRYLLRDLSVSVDPPGVTISDGILGKPDCWHVRQHCVGPRHVLALAWRGPDAGVTLASGDVRSLLDELQA